MKKVGKKVMIQEQLLSDLTEIVRTKGKETTPKIKLDVAVCFVSLLNSVPVSRRDEDTDKREEGVNLYSQILKENYHPRYNVYFDFLIKYKFVELVSNYGADTGESNRYKIHDNYREDNQVVYIITDKVLLKKFTTKGVTNFQLAKMEFCKEQRPHLVKFFDNKLTIDFAGAMKEASGLTCYQSYNRCTQNICTFDEGAFTYSMNPASDNRLHSSLTQTNKVIRAYISYDGESIIGIDVKSSIPYFLCSVLKAIYTKDKSLLEQVGATQILDDNLIEELFKLDVDKAKITEFALLVLNPSGGNDIYETFAGNLDIQYNIEGLPIRKVSNFKSRNKGKRRKKFKDIRTTITYKSERDLAKKVMLEIFNSKSKTTIPEAKVFRALFPDVVKIMNLIKDNGVPIWRLLSHIEAHCLLDVATKRIAIKHPDLFMLSIHDSIVTTESKVYFLEKELAKHVKDITGLKYPPRFDHEDWREELKSLSA